MTKSKAVGPLSDDEIIASLEGAGYPLELRVFDELLKHGMNPVFGFRAKVADGDELATKDIDIVASENIIVPREKNGPARASLKALIAVKKIHDGAFIGFTSQEPSSRQEIRSLRSTVGGLPHWRAINQTGFDVYGEYFYGEAGLGAALGGLHGGPVCIQWTVAKRNQLGEPRADQERGVFDDIVTTVRSAAIQRRDVTFHRLTLDRDQSKPDLHFYFPTLVLDAPLRVYDPTSRSLTSVDALAIKTVMDTTLGPTPVMIDVVARTALEAFVERYRRAGQAMKDWLEVEENALMLGLAGLQQHEEHTESAKRRTHASG